MLSNVPREHHEHSLERLPKMLLGVPIGDFLGEYYKMPQRVSLV